MSQCSDADSSSELGTPESSLASWPSALVVDAASTLAALQTSGPSPNHAFKQSQRDTTMLDSGVDMMAPPRELDAASLQLDRLAIQRPARLERLSSAATTATARPSSPSDDSPAHTATQSPRHSQASDLSSLSLSSRTTLSKPVSLDNNVPIGANPSSPDDAWRSLLPKEDPYFAPDSQPRFSQQFERSASPQCLPSTSSAAFDIDAYAAAKSSPRASTIDRMSTSSLGTSRTSFSSINSGFSAMSMSGVNNKLSRQSHDSARSDSWTSFLPEGDRYLTSRNADASASQIGSAASPSLTSPSLSDRLDSPTSSDSHNHRSAFPALKTPRSNEGASSSDSDSASRRHASFSSVDSDTIKQRAATRAMPTIVRDGARLFAKSASQNSERTALPYASSSSSSSSAGVVSPPARDSFDAPRISSELSPSKLEDDTSERDSWPTSRIDRSGRLGSTGSSDRSTPETTPSLETHLGPRDKSSLAIIPPRVVETSDSTVQATQTDLPATTTTTPTITKTLTAATGAQPLLDVEASRTSNKARSEADVDDGAKLLEKGDDKLQWPSTKARASSCSISTPVSCMDHLFLDRRPAPPGTNLVIEPERTRYVVLVSLPGFSLNCITVATKRNAKEYTLHVVADKYDAEGGGHFERRVSFSEKDCDMVGVRSEFDGNTLRVVVPRILSGSRSSIANSARF